MFIISENERKKIFELQGWEYYERAQVHALKTFYKAIHKFLNRKSTEMESERFKKYWKCIYARDPRVDEFDICLEAVLHVLKGTNP